MTHREPDDWPWAAWGLLGVLVALLLLGPIDWLVVMYCYGLNTDYFDGTCFVYLVLSLICVGILGWRPGVKFGEKRNFPQR